jgi:hypothetical protein
MKVIQNKIIISQKAFIIHIYGLHHYKGKLSFFFSEYITFSINFNMGTFGGMTNIQMIFNLVPRFLKCVWCYCSHSSSMSRYERPVTVFSEKKKNGPIDLLRIKLAHMIILGLPLSNSCDMWILTTPKPAAVPVYNSSDMECRLSEKHTWRRKSSDVSILSSTSTVKFMRATWSLGFSAWIIWILYALMQGLLCSTLCTAERGICNCKLAEWIDLRGLSNATDIFFRGLCLSRFFTQ